MVDDPANFHPDFFWCTYLGYDSYPGQPVYLRVVLVIFILLL